MNDDLLQGLHELPPEDLAAPPDRLERVFTRARRRRRQRVTGVLVAAALVAAGVVLGLTLPGGAQQSLREVSPGPTASPAPPGPTPATTPAPGAVRSAPPRLIPQSVSFVSTSLGWAFGPAQWPSGDQQPPTADGVLAVTRDGGRNWAQLPSPGVQFTNSTGGVRWVRFVSADRGYLYRDQLYATGDGGQHWQRIHAPGPVLNLITTDRLYLMIGSGCASGFCDRAALYTADLSGAGLRQVTDVRTTPDAQLAVAGNRLYLLSRTVGPAGAASSATLWATVDGTTWTTRTAPCHTSATDFGALATFGSNGLALVCGDQPSAGWQPKTAFLSTDAGSHWTRQSQGAAIPAAGYVGSLATAGENIWLLGELRGGLLVSHDAGHSWTAANLPSDASVEGWGQVQVVDPALAVAVPWTLNGGVIAFTHDAGTTWTAARFNPLALPAGTDLCQFALGASVVASSSTTVAEARAWFVGGPSPATSESASRHPARDAWPGIPGDTPAAWCTTGANGNYTFYAVGPDGTDVRLETVNGVSGPPPNHPLVIP